MAGLRLAGFTVDHVASAAQGRAATHGEEPIDLVLLDLSLPDDDGLQLVREWRSKGSSMPVLILTARDAVKHRIAGLSAGADDYVTKPFDLGELIARVHALLRRASGHGSDLISHGRLTFSQSEGVAWFDGERVELSRRELALLRAFLMRPAAVLSADQLRAALYGFDDVVESNAINVHIHFLRRKFGPSIIETVRGVGFRLGKAA